RRAWRKLRHTNVRDAAVIGYTGTPRRPLALVLVLPGEEDEAPLVSSPLSAVLRTELAAVLAERGGAGTGGGVVTAIGLGEVPFSLLDPPLAAEVRHTALRHPPPEVLRLRTDL
ncbi:DNA ligase, partial [Streptomyces sp. C]